MLAALAACGDTKESEKTAASGNAEISEDPSAVKFPEADYDGVDFTVYNRSQTASHYRGLYIVPLEDSADVIDEQAQIRNIRVEEYYHVKLKSIEVDSPNGTVRTDIASGDTPYFALLDMRRKVGPLGRQGLLYNFLELDVDYTTEWWDKNAAEQYEVEGKLYCMPNDVSISNLCGTRFFYFNKAVMEDLSLDNPYDLAAKNEWTVENFFRLTKSVSLSGSDGGYGVFGYLDAENDSVFHMLTGIGVPRVVKNEEGTMVCTMGEDYADRTQTFLEAYKQLAENKNYVQNYDDVERDDAAGASAYADYWAHARGMFATNHFLFVHADMDSAHREFTEMPRGFGIIMNPKYDSEQEDYYHMMDNNALIWAIPADPNMDLDMVGNVFDYWAYTSKSTVMESFYELTIKAKRASDPTTASMLDTIKASIRYYPTDLYKVEEVDIMLQKAYDASISQAWRTYSSVINRNLERICEDIADNEY